MGGNDDELLRALARDQRRDLAEHSEALADGQPTLGADDRAQLLELVTSRLSRVEARADPPQPPVELASRRRTGRWAAAAGVLAAAAVLALWLGLRGDDPVSVAALPDYQVTRVAGGQASERGASEGPVGAPLRIAADGRIDIVVTPAEPVVGELAVALSARSRAGAERFAGRVAAEVSTRGAVRLRGSLREFIELEPGAWTLTIHIATPQELPTSADAAAREASSEAGPEGGAVRRVAVELRVVP